MVTLRTAMEDGTVVETSADTPRNAIQLAESECGRHARFCIYPSCDEGVLTCIEKSLLDGTVAPYVGDTLWLRAMWPWADRAKMRPHVLQFFSRAGFPGTRLCFRCNKRPAELNATLIQDVVKAKSTGGTMGTGIITRRESVYLEVGTPRCSECAQQETSMLRRPALVQNMGFGVFGMAVVVGICLLYLRDREVVRQILSHVNGMVLWAGLLLLGFFLTGFGESLKRRAIRSLTRMGLFMGDHPDVTLAGKLCEEMIDAAIDCRKPFQ